jgi:gliding motility-associated-like protein
MVYLRILIALLIVSLFFRVTAMAQTCTTLGQNPSTAFPVCGTTTFAQTTVPICASNDLAVPGCSGNGGALYQNKNPFWYKFTCYQSGTLGFIITPNDLTEDYDWQLYDITGRDPNDVYTDASLVITGNWSGSSGLTGASLTGNASISCASVPSDNVPTFAKWPDLVAGHEYLLMISHFTDTQSGYSLSFGGGTAIITDPTLPHLLKAIPDCDGKGIVLKLNKNMRCGSLTAIGSEFSISPAVVTVVSATGPDCTSGFDLDEVVITLSGALPSGSYQLVINNGTDLNTLLDNCDDPIPAGESIPFDYIIPQPILADSIEKPACAPASVRIYYPKKIDCNTISASGSDFSISGPTPVTIMGAGGKCVNDLTDYIIVQFAAPIYTKGNYTLSIQPGIDGSPIYDLCGQPLLPQMLTFTTADTVSAFFNISTKLGCQRDTLTFSHDGAHDVNYWNWAINGNSIANTASTSFIFPATSTNSVQLAVSNGVCSDTGTQALVFNNEVKAAFTMPDVICPEDPLLVTDSSTGQIDAWLWKYDVMGTSSVQAPPPFHFPLTNRDTYYTIQLRVTNIALGCSDSARKRLRVLSNCFIAVPTAFTPNGDGLNDYLSPNNAYKADNLEFKVFNRWGQLVFATRNWLEKWNGKIKDLPQAAGIYVWFLSYTNRDTGQKIFQKGTTMLIR